MRTQFQKDTGNTRAMKNALDKIALENNWSSLEEINKKRKEEGYPKMRCEKK